MAFGVTNSKTEMIGMDRLESFAILLSQTGNVSKTARIVGIAPTTLYERRRRDPWFAQLWKEALDDHLDNCEQEVHRRGFQGFLEPIFYRGEECAEVRKYSDRCALSYLAAKRANWRRGAVINQDQRQLNIYGQGQPDHAQDTAHPPPRPSTIEEWEEQVRAARARRKALQDQPEEPPRLASVTPVIDNDVDEDRDE